MNNAVPIKADCEQANFKLADLHGADFGRVALVKTSFEDAKIYGTKLDKAVVGDNPYAQVDLSLEGDRAIMVSVRE